MIIFDLDGTLADCEHRRHFVEPLHPKNIDNAEMLSYNAYTGELVKAIGWKPNWKAFYEACDQDTPNIAVLDVFIHLTQGEPFNHDIQIWSGRCESVRGKTLKWLTDLSGYTEDIRYWDRRLKMRPIGDNTPDDQLKERWLDETYQDTKWGRKTTIEFAFDSEPDSITMWRRRGVFVFDCNQNGREF